MSLRIQRAGILTTVQDLGRNKFRRFGINPNGAMDKTAARLINILLGNDENEAILETHFPAPEITFEEKSFFALGGADFDAELDKVKVENWRPHFAEKNAVLKFTGKISGNRAYLAVEGGFKIKKWLGSASTNLTARIGGFAGKKLQKGDKLFFNQKQKSKNKNLKIRNQMPNYKISNSLIPVYSRFPTVRIIVGAEFELLTAYSEQSFLRQDFIVSQNSNRMGFRLAGKPLYTIDEKEVISSAVDFGTIQLLPDGQLIILMADHQTTGGYPRFAHVIETDLPLVAQLGANDKIAFHLISLAEAENIRFDYEKNLNLLRVGCKFIEYFN